MTIKTIEGRLESITPRLIKKETKEIWLVKVGELTITCWNDLLFQGFSSGDLVIAEYDEQINGIYTNRNLKKLTKKEDEIKSAEELSKLPKIDYDKITKERVEKIENEVTNIIEVAGKKYKMILQEI